MKILQITSGTNVNGALTYCKFLSETLRELGHDVSVMCRAKSWLVDHLDPDIPVFHSEQNRSPSELFRIANWIREQQFDVMHTHMSRAHTLGVIMRYLTHTPVVATAHQCSFQLHWRMNDFVIANSDYTANYQRRFNLVPADRLGTIHCFTDLKRFRQIQPRHVAHVQGELRLTGDEFLVGVVGDVIHRKGHKYLFEAMPRVVEAVPEFKLVLIGRFNRGERYVKQLRRFQIRNQLFRRVYWLGLRHNVQDFMAAFDVSVVPSLEEPLGLVALESMAAGTPVIASATGGLKEIVSNGENGLLFEPKNSKQLADQLIELARNRRRRTELGQSGREFVERAFDPKKLASQVVSVYQSLQSSRRRAA